MGWRVGDRMATTSLHYGGGLNNTTVYTLGDGQAFQFADHTDVPDDPDVLKSLRVAGAGTKVNTYPWDDVHRIVGFVLPDGRTYDLRCTR